MPRYAKGLFGAQNDQLSGGGEQLKVLTDSIFSLRKKEAAHEKKVSEYVRIIQDYKASDKFAAFIDQPITQEIAGHMTIEKKEDTNMIRVPCPFSFRDSTVSFSGNVEKLGVRIDSIRIENTLHYRVVSYGTGFLHLSSISKVEAMNSNPAITNVGLTSIIVPTRVNWWNRWGKPVLAAVLAGAAVDHFNH